MIGVLIKKGNLDTDRCTQGEHHVKMEPDIEVMLLQAKEHP